jgi:NTE family protein
MTSATNTSATVSKKHKLPPQRPHRVLVLQGGGALAAYEAGVFAVLAQKLSEKDKRDGRTGNMFDIVAGTSGGAINAALIVNYVLKNNTWNDVAKVPLAFWRATASDISFWPKNELFKQFWKYLEISRDKNNAFWKTVAESAWFKPLFAQREQSLFLPMYFLWPDSWGPLASEEAARRYWTWYTYSFGFQGIPGVLTRAIYQPDYKFVWNPLNFLIRYGNSPIVDTIKEFWNFDEDRIRTTEGQPRLMMVSVDIRDGMTATFDSYPKEDGELKTLYEHKLPDGKRERHIIQYNSGLGIEHLLTSMSSALRYAPPSLDAVTETIMRQGNNEGGRPGKKKEEIILSSKKEQRFFWDGFYLSNTPLREVLQAQ